MPRFFVTAMTHNHGTAPNTQRKNKKNGASILFRVMFWILFFSSHADDPPTDIYPACALFPYHSSCRRVRMSRPSEIV